MLSSFAVISYTNNWIYVCFAVIGSWIGAYVTLKYLNRRQVIPRTVEGRPLRTSGDDHSVNGFPVRRSCR